MTEKEVRKLEKDKRVHSYHCMVTAGERALFDKAAKYENFDTTSAWVRKTLLDRVDRLREDVGDKVARKGD